jgi:hypothetical protein
MAPDTSQVFVAFDGKKMGLSATTQLEALTALREAKGFQELQKQVREKLGLELESDILAAIEPQVSFFIAPEEGKASFLTDIEKSGSPPPFRVCLLLGLRDQEKASKALAAIETKTGVAYGMETHAGVTLHAPATTGKGPAWAINDGVLLVGAATADLKLSIDRGKKTGKSLSDSRRYQEALARVQHKGVMLAYADLQGMLTGDLLQKIEQKDAREMVGALRVLVAGMAVEGKDLLSEGQITIDPKAGGTLATELFKPEYGIEMRSLAMVPADTEMFFALNLKMLWQMTYDVMGHSPEGRMMREAPAMQAQQQQIDLQKDVIDALTGEIAVSFPNYSQVAAAQFPGLGKEATPAASMAALQQLKALVLLPLAHRAKIDALLGKPVMAPMLASLSSEDYKGTTIRSQGALFGYAIHSDTLLVGVNDDGKQIRGIIDGTPAGKSLATHPGRTRLDTLLAGSKPIFMSFADTARVYGTAARGLEAKDPGTARLLGLMARMGSTWQAWTLRKDGVYFYGVTTDTKL